MEKSWFCSICENKIDVIHYAIRDMKPSESCTEWFWRHFVGAVTIGLKRRKHAVIIPVCDSCAKARLTNNMAGSEQVAC